MQPALAFLAGDRSTDVLDALADGMRRWAAQEGAGDAMPVNRYVGLPASPCKTRRALRDAILRDAAVLLDAPTPWLRACTLADRCRLFELRRWPAWRHLEAPPLRASALEVLLFEARQFGVVMLSARRIHDLLL